MFKQVDNHWKAITDASKGKKVIEVCDDDKLKKDLVEDIASLDKVTKNLEN